MTLPYRRFSTAPVVQRFGHEWSGGTKHETRAYFSLVGGELVAGMDEVCKAIAPYDLSIVTDNCDPQITDYLLARGIRPINFVTWNYPIGYPPVSGDAVFIAWLAGVDNYANVDQVDLMNVGIFFRTSNYNPQQPNQEGEKIESQIIVSNVKVYYFNPVVSAFSHDSLRIGEQVKFVITGLGFDQDNVEIDEGGNPKDWPGWVSYVTEIEFWHMQRAMGEWLDDFDDVIRDPAWSDEPNNGTIDEAEGELTLAIANGEDGEWWQPNVENAPFAKLSPGMDKITIVTKLKSFTLNNQTGAGLMIGNTTTIPDTAGGYCFSFMRLLAPGLEGLYIRDMGKAPGTPIYVPEATLPIWLRIVADGSGAGSTISFDYSTNGEDWTTADIRYNFTWSLIGLCARNWGTPKLAISAPFEFFKYSWGGVASHTLKLTDGDFTLDNDAKITIPQAKFPALLYGTYRLILRKTLIKIASFLAEGMAGVWRPDGIGLCTAGAPLEIRVGLMPSIGIRGKARAVPLLCFTWKNKLGETYEDCVAPIDIRAPETFYDGRIIGLSSAQRSIDHRTGLFNVSDATVRLVNTDKKYSKLLANWFLKNQPLDLWYATAFEPEASKTPIIGMIVEDYHLQGTEFIIRMKDITQKYFKKKIPPRMCTELTFPQIHPDEIGKAFPEVLGLCVLGTNFEHPGAVQAIYIDTLVYEYLATNGILNSVTEVYSDDSLVDPADYSIVYRDGCTFIDFIADQEDKNISFNAQGYSVAGLNSANGYIQNPAYIIFYYLNNILEVPTELLNAATFDTLATIYDDLGVGESGKLIIQTRQDSMEVLRQLLFTCGAHGFIANDGRFVVERKDIYNYATDTFLFDQIDLITPAVREFNLTQAINTVKARWDYIPCQRLFKDAKEDYKDNKFEADMEDDIKMPREREDRGTRRL